MKNDGPENFEEALKVLEESRKEQQSQRGDKIYSLIFCVILFILLGFVVIKKMMTDYEFRKLQAEAVQKGYAEFEVDNSYSPSFSWKEETQKKEEIK